MPSYSAVVPAHNAAETLPLTLASLCSAGVTEIIVIDDASSDATATIAKSVSHPGVRVQVISNSRACGPATARNQGLAEVTTEWVIFCDADDELFPEALEIFGSETSDSVVAVMGRFLAIDERGNALDIGTWASEQLRPVHRRRGRYLPVSEIDSEAILTRLVVQPPSGIAVRTAAARIIGGYNTELGRSEDLDFLVRLSRQCRLAIVDRDVVKYRRNPAQRSQATKARQRGRQKALVHIILSAPRSSERWALARAAAAHHFDRAATRRRGAHTLKDWGVALRSYLLGAGFRLLGAVGLFVHR